MSKIERFVPLGASSLASDAPGWNSKDSTISSSPTITSSSLSLSSSGPICWKCKGSGQVLDKKKKPERKRQRTATSPLSSSATSIDKDTHKVSKISNNNIDLSKKKECTVCDGKGTLQQKQKEMKSFSQPGMITLKRKYKKDWVPSRPIAYAVAQMTEFMKDFYNLSKEDQEKCKQHPLYLLNEANADNPINDIEGIFIPQSASCNAVCQGDKKEIDDVVSSYPWLPLHPGEQLCNLVGTWRILQRVGSHRWTTDDIFTAYVARNEILKKPAFSLNNEENKPRRPLLYLDLGTGNASVLQMVAWSIIDKSDLQAYGIEARSEALALAKRSLSFNIGRDNLGKKISLISGDFRAIIEDKKHDIEENRTTCTTNHNDNVAGIHDDQMEMFRTIKNQKFDLITGTPPYFRVDFSTAGKSSNDANRVVEKAVINQGGMPTSKQSAPARCEFRGGIESYCDAAATILSPSGVFVVCENWLNNDRVYKSAKDSGLQIQKVFPVKGTTRKGSNLFAVYVMGINSTKNRDDSSKENIDVSTPISVRDHSGKWTAEYAEVMESMSVSSA